jgi:hypothetical protein
MTRSSDRQLLRWLALWLDTRFRIPGTNIRFGLDPLLSLLPGVGDLASPLFTALLLAHGLSARVPRVVMLRMMLNALFDALIGVIPAAGTVADVFWRANTKNLALLERHAQPGRPATRGDYVFVFLSIGIFGLLAFVPIVLGIWIAIALWGQVLN